MGFRVSLCAQCILPFRPFIGFGSLGALGQMLAIDFEQSNLTWGSRELQTVLSIAG
ncbi:hypothetical protein MES5069_680019 [Mesorhizobium escarrei]|uniref:Uncharacterized protein n=1 Tax=Mesorhizobium escarrei TaxID=666018 RepID=A0ABM9EG15_9HYPH|nr:hypothetical protein MES5069_680019 [Mesorhizobium escarrei]